MNIGHSFQTKYYMGECPGRRVKVKEIYRSEHNDREIVSAHERDAELRRGCQLNSSRHAGFDNSQRPDKWRGGAQPE